MIITILILLLLLSFTLHICFIILYIYKRHKSFLTLFLNTTVSNIALASSITFIMIMRPQDIRKFDIHVLLWLFSGFITILTLGIKITIFRRMYKNIKNPKNFHYNYFGKKVLEKDAVSQLDMLLFFGTMPFFLLAGAYFVACLINIILHGHL
jgi:hypothetical protein